MDSIYCNCLKYNGEKCRKEVSYKFEFIKYKDKTVKYSCKLLFHRRGIISELDNDCRLNIYRKSGDMFYSEYNNLTCTKCVEIFDTLFYQPHTKKKTLYIKYRKLQRKYHNELEKLEALYPTLVVSKSYDARDRLKNEMLMIMTPYVERGYFGKFKTELELQNAVNNLNVLLLKERNYLMEYEMYFYMYITKNRYKYITAKEEYISEFYEVKLEYLDKKEKECSICMNNINENNGGYLDCGHCFHNDCLGKWIEIKTDCPMCRKHFNKLKIMKSM